MNSDSLYFSMAVHRLTPNGRSAQTWLAEVDREVEGQNSIYINDIYPRIDCLQIKGLTCATRRLKRCEFRPYGCEQGAHWWRCSKPEWGRHAENSRILCRCLASTKHHNSALCAGIAFRLEHRRKRTPTNVRLLSRHKFCIPLRIFYAFYSPAVPYFEQFDEFLTFFSLPNHFLRG